MSIPKLLYSSLLLFFFASFPLKGQSPSVLDTEINLAGGEYELQELLDKLNSIPAVSIAYNSNDLPLTSIVFLEASGTSLQSVLDAIVEQVSLQYQVKNNYVILKNRGSDLKYTLSGTISDAETGELLIGVSIYIPGVFVGSVSDINGCFKIKAPPGQFPVIAGFLGYSSKEIQVSLIGDKHIEIQLVPANLMINEVNIIAQRNYFGNLNMGRSIAAISAEEFSNMNANNVADILHAREPGVWTTRTSGAPGDHQRIRIRGIHSIYSVVDPLYVVDGVPIPNVNIASLGVNDINVHDIEQVTILKDISSAALYGFQGGNGVVLIDTKKGDETSIKFSSRFGVQHFNSFYPLLNTRDFLSSINTYSDSFESDLDQYYPEYSDTLADNSWQEEFFQPGMVQEYLLSLSGTANTFHYYFSGSYFNQQGILPHSEYRKYTFLTNLGKTFYNRFTLGLNYHAGLQNNKNNLDTYMGNTQFLGAINQSPCAGSTPDSLLYGPEGMPNERTYYPYPAFYGGFNSDSLFIKNGKKLDIASHTASVALNIHLFDNLYLDASTSLSYRKYTYESKASFYYNGNYDGFLSNYEKYYFSNQRLILSWSKSFGRHELNMAGGFRMYRDRAQWEVDSVYPNYSIESGTEELFIRNSLARYAEEGDISRKITSWVGHVNYIFNKKYSLSFASDYDQLEEGSFIKTQVLFPSVALNWDISREPIINRVNWIDMLNLYVNWGKAGNYPLSILAGSLFEDIPYVFGDSVSGGSTEVSLVTNYQLKHEEMEEINYGIHLSAFNKRIEVDANFFRRTDRNLIVESTLPMYAGGGTAYLNIAKINGEGKEFGLELMPVFRSNINWFTRFGFSQFRQKVIKLNSERAIAFTNPDILIPDMIISEGEELGNIFGYEYLGQSADDKAPTPESGYVDEFGFRYSDLDGNGRLSAGDTTKLGNSIPDYTWSWYNSLSLKNFTFDFLWYAVLGYSKFNGTRASSYISGLNSDIPVLLNDSVNAFANRYVYESSYFVEDASFIRLKYVTFTYHPERKLWNKIDYSISLSLENLLTFTSYKGYDPEATIYTGNSFTDNAIDRGAYPTPKAAYVSISLKF